MLKEIADYIREQTSAPLILGGSGFSIMPEVILNYLGLDLGITGDGKVSPPPAGKKAGIKEVGLELSSPAWYSVLTGPSAVSPPSYIDMHYFPTPRRESVDNGRYFAEGGMGSIEDQARLP